MQASEMTFGVEIETSISSNVPFRVGGYHSAEKIRTHGMTATNAVRYAPLDGWAAERDSSIMCRTDSTQPQQACEFVSPVLKGLEGQRRLYDAVRCIKDVVRATVNSSCGIHVHVGFPSDPEALKRLVHLVAAHEKALFAVSGTPRRESGRFCKGIQRDYDPNRVQFSTSEYEGLTCQQHSAVSDRYRILNLTNMLAGGRQTVEFRVFSGSIRPERILAWVRLCLSLCELAVEADRACKWTHDDKAVANKRTDKTRNSTGFIALRVLLYKIGWDRGRNYVKLGTNAEGKAIYQTVKDANGQDVMDPKTGKPVLVHRTYGGSLDGGPGLPGLTEGKNNSRLVLKQLADKYDEKVATGSL